VNDVKKISEWIPLILPEILVITDVGGFEASPGQGSARIGFRVPFSAIQERKTFYIIMNADGVSHALAGFWIPDAQTIYLFDPNGDRAPNKNTPLYSSPVFERNIEKYGPLYNVRSALYATLANYFEENRIYSTLKIDFWRGNGIACPNIRTSASGTCAYRTFAFMLAIMVNAQDPFKYAEDLMSQKGKDIVSFLDDTIDVLDHINLSDQDKLKHVVELATL